MQPAVPRKTSQTSRQRAGVGELMDDQGASQGQGRAQRESRSRFVPDDSFLGMFLIGGLGVWVLDWNDTVRRSFQAPTFPSLIERCIILSLRSSFVTTRSLLLGNAAIIVCMIGVTAVWTVCMSMSYFQAPGMHTRLRHAWARRGVLCR